MKNIGKNITGFAARAALPLRTRLLVAILVLAAAAATWTNALADVFPDKPIRFILGFGAGGPTDVVARTLGDQLTKELGQRVVVENKTGAAGNIATQAVVAADADGYTFLIGASPLAVNETLYPDFPVKFGRDLVAVAPIGANVNVLVARPLLNIRTVAALVERARSKPDAVSYATVGNGSTSHLGGLSLDMRAGTQMLAVSYRGGGDALKDLIGGQVDIYIGPITSVLGAIQTGQLVALATTGPQRSPKLPDVPTMAESGFPGFDIRLWVGLFARPGIPADRMQIIEQAVARAMAAPDVKTALDHQAIVPMPMSRAEFDVFVMREIERWRIVVNSVKK